MFPAFSICSLWDSCLGISIPSLGNWPSDFYSLKIGPGNLHPGLDPSESSFSGNKGPLPGTFDSIRASISSHTMNRGYLLPLKVISLMHEGQISPTWLTVVTENLTRSMSSPLLIKGIALPLLSLSLETMWGPSKQNSLLHYLHFYQLWTFFMSDNVSVIHNSRTHKLLFTASTPHYKPVTHNCIILILYNDRRAVFKFQKLVFAISHKLPIWVIIFWIVF